MERLITIKQFAEMNGIGRSTVYRENKAGRLPFEKIGRATRIRMSVAIDWQLALQVSGRV